MTTLLQYWPEFLTVVIIHFLAVASPGPDFAVILRQSLCAGPRIGVWTGIGIGSGILVHVTYSLLGLGLLIAQSTTAFTVLKVLGAVYLLWVGWQCLKAKPASTEEQNLSDVEYEQSIWQAWRLGFLTNVLNAKATLFFVSLFSVVISPTTPIWMQGIYGLWMTLATGFWFVGLALFLSRQQVRSFFRRISHWIERVTGVALIALAGKLAMTQN
ncbi:resistance to homoserine/threonine (RhtB) family protein [Oceanospirillum multiglobuliferum]|uniref:Lysine transporter LysE n=1 Tax=Oceanospirillum multiglobuliferum TaxID=64969 RepID=A0A1T4LF74_9GAMM|nr:LysE family transporter [Oceanospirillum multiglobuliferum]OPX56685.1 lysine transporter LysE [Oceanospirillum multiglobuliferum]SJZ53218.1 resistance to homoserine/threonine (RhtB) family protein [Oceanospirillum multiglobuliferum]